MSSNSNLDAIQLGLTKVLSVDGFARSGRTFRRVVEADIAQVIQVQAGQRSLLGQFTINIGVFLPECHRFFAGNAVSKVDEADCEIRTRIGQLLPIPEDTWWSHTPLAGETVGEVQQTVTGYALPFLESVASRRLILKAWSAGILAGFMYPRREVAIALILARVGETPEALRLLATLSASPNVHSARMAENARNFIVSGSEEHRT